MFLWLLCLSTARNGKVSGRALVACCCSRWNWSLGSRNCLRRKSPGRSGLNSKAPLSDVALERSLCSKREGLWCKVLSQSHGHQARELHMGTKSNIWPNGTRDSDHQARRCGN